MNKPIFLLGSHKSGTTLLRSLFDGHPDLFVVPIELHFFQMSGYWVDYRIRREFPRTLSRDERIEKMCAHIEMSNTTYDDKSDNFSQHRWNTEDFKASLKAANPDSEVEWFNAYVAAAHKSLTGQELNTETRVVEKTVENAEFAFDLRSMHPGCKFVHIVRNPYSALVAIRKYRSKRGFPYLGSLLRSIYNSYYFLYKNQRLLENYHVVRYEDLVTEPEKHMSEICDFLDLQQTDSLLKPTYLGENWAGNSSSGKQFDGISASRVDTWKSEIFPFEVSLINRYLSHVVRDFGYERIEPSKSIWWPMPRESLKHYLANRVIFM